MSQTDEIDIDAPEDHYTDNRQNAYNNSAHTVAPTSTALQVQAIKADYYNIADAEDWPVAGLVVLLDRRRQPVRAELHLYEESDKYDEFALRHAQALLAERYYSTDPVQMQVMQSYAWRETLAIQPSGNAVTPENDPLAFVRQYWQYIAAGSAALVLLFLIWSIISFFRSPEEAAPVVETPVVAAAESSGESTSTTTDAAAPVATTPALGAQLNGLPTSRNADPGLAVGGRAIIQPGMTASLVSEPSSDQSKVIGALTEGTIVTLIDGPVQLQGNSDTIVWFRVRLDSGAEGWAPANTSEFTILRPTQ